MIDRRETLRKLALRAAGYSGIAPLAAPFLSGLGAILMLHRVNDGPASPIGLNSHLSITPQFLDELIRDMKRAGYAFVPLDEVVERLRGGGGAKFAAITADDAYLDNLTDALPVFEEHDAPFAVYVAPGLIDGDVLPWWEVIEDLVAARERIELPSPAKGTTLECGTVDEKRVAAARLLAFFTSQIVETDHQRMLEALGARPDDESGRRFMSWEEIRRLAEHPLATIGAHTVHHYNLKRLDADLALREMTESARLIGEKIGRRPRHFAYPYGYAAAVGEREVALAREAGFASAVTTRHGLLQAAHAQALHALPRLSVNGRYQDLAFMRTMLSGITTPLANSGRKVVTV
ncbi:polysaccharide deacetylase family protein [Aquamicrobium sp. LC103]|uniref:polysaccharide deacetylase family protein n=1 Tax=Aquamicrobium sp. LC103 TaxID=1120658 RepID=UPI00063E82D5|nr:polysaccharide deacetylase family protein [Aquamicrobium sp. LC103]TKT81439.1 polysaccharide deacetylase [Aquamicrobium sp. LC103]